MSRDWTREEFGITDNTPVVDIDSLERKCERLQKQLDIAVNCLKEYANRDNWYNIYKPNSLNECPIASKERWKKEYGYKQAEKALGKIEGLNK